MNKPRNRKRKPKRNFILYAVHHIYHRAKDHGIVFYTDEDRLVYYTVLSVKSMFNHVKVLAASIMFSHVHLSVSASNDNDISNFCHDAETSFARMYNYEHGRRGPLVEEHFGWAQKQSRKSSRTNLIYVFNNHVEKGLCKEAAKERWSFLAYMLSNHPFSEPLDRGKCSRVLSMSLNLIDRRIKKLQPIRYKDTHRILPKLSETEREQLIDYAIVKYALIDFDVTVSYFGSKEAVILAANSTTGAEYEIKEEYSPDTDIAYEKMTSFLQRKKINSVYTLTIKERGELALEFLKSFSASKNQLEKFFHCKFCKRLRVDAVKL